MGKGEDPHWVIEISRERLLALTKSEPFWSLMRLARHVNALRFGQAALFHANGDDGPIGRRARPSSFFYNGSVLFEALALVPELRKHHSTNPYWERSFGRFGSDAEVRALAAQGTDLHRLRNHVGFHVLDIVPERSLPSLDLPDYILASGHGFTQGQVYYDLADTIALHYLLGAPKSFDAFIAAFSDRGATITALLMDYLEASDIFLPRAFEALGLTIRIVDPDANGDAA